jgi:TPR repeat protein
MFELGNAYRYGRSVRKSRSQAVSWYRKAAAEGHRAARAALKAMGVDRPQRKSRRPAAPPPEEEPEYAD